VEDLTRAERGLSHGSQHACKLLKIKAQKIVVRSLHMASNGVQLFPLQVRPKLGQCFQQFSTSPLSC